MKYLIIAILAFILGSALTGSAMTALAFAGIAAGGYYYYNKKKGLIGSTRSAMVY